ncbi:MAG: aminopeptidase P family protein [Calditrichaeota bacterium]|nr:MAG: aminopeptidase P family protein [Calditrichota bacterium]MBL1206476.1 aminopeptidase P family protein [Calditrichota bacterium]NOG46303.1 aminopeptidase P family protein [Calditrichota bacterium]
MFKKETYKSRRAQLKNQFHSGLLLFLGNDESPMNYADNTFHFRQDSTFLYYFGLDNPGLVGLIDLDNDKEIIFGDDLTIDDVVWMGSQPSIMERSEKVGISKTGSLNEMYDFLQQALTKNRKIHFLPAYRAEHQIKLFNWLKIPVNETNNNASIDLIVAVAEQRNIKSAEEIEQIEQAVSVTADMHFAAMRFAKPGMTEAQVAAKVHEVALADGGNLSFPIIATINGQTLHNHYHGNTIKDGDLFLLDAGAENELHYAGDMSSTFPVSAKFTERQKEIYQIALDAHNAAINALKPGIDFKEIHFTASRHIFNGLKEMGYTKGDTEEAINAGAHALFLPCGTGHLMGLDVHDMENLGEQYVGYAGQQKSTLFGLKSLRLGREIKPGYVFTIEPGIYFIPELIDLWKSKKKFTEFINYEKVEEYKDFGGTRNEENLVITKDGYKILGKPLAKSIEDVEAERAKAF